MKKLIQQLKPELQIAIVVAIIGALATIIASLLPLIWPDDSSELPPTSISTSVFDSSDNIGLPATYDANDFIVNNIPMRLIPSGDFIMGGDSGSGMAECQKFHIICRQEWFVNQEPIHNANVNAFYIDKYEVTNSMYRSCVDSGVCLPPRHEDSSTRLNYYSSPEFDNYPMIWADWYMAQTYCEWRDGRLPTEAEWEKASRGPDGRLYPWGNGIDCSQANFNNCVGDTTAVGNYEQGKSIYGVYDLVGNTWEWTNSGYYTYPYIFNDGREESLVLMDRVIRGGSYYDPVVISTFRSGFSPLDTKTLSVN